MEKDNKRRMAYVTASIFIIILMSVGVYFKVMAYERQSGLDMLRDKMWAHGVHISVGALWQARCDDPEELFRGADARMYEAKQAYYRRLAEVEG